MVIVFLKKIYLERPLLLRRCFAYIYYTICRRTIMYTEKKEIAKSVGEIIEKNNTKYSRYRNGDEHGCCQHKKYQLQGRKIAWKVRI